MKADAFIFVAALHLLLQLLLVVQKFHKTNGLDSKRHVIWAQVSWWKFTRLSRTEVNFVDCFALSSGSQEENI